MVPYYRRVNAIQVDADATIDHGVRLVELPDRTRNRYEGVPVDSTALRRTAKSDFSIQILPKSIQKN